MKKKIFTKVFSNWGLKLLSLLIAFGLWIVVVLLENPPDTTYLRNISVKLLNVEELTDKGKVYEILDNSDVVKRVTVRGPKKVVSQLTESDIIATADVSKLTNMDTIQVEFSIPKYRDELEITTADGDAVVKLFVEERKSANVPLKVMTKGEVKEGYQLDYTKPNENRINIWGGASKIDEVSYAAVTVDINNIDSELSTSETIRLYDKDDNLLDSSSIYKKAETMHVIVGVLATKTVPIKYEVMGTPAAGYRETGVVESSLDTVKIAGSSSVLNRIGSISIPAELLNITGQTEDLIQVYDIRGYLPDGVSLAKDGFNGSVSVTVYIEKEAQKKMSISARNINVMNVPEGFIVERNDEELTYDLQVTGLEAEISLLNEATVRGTVDIAAWMAEQEMEELVPGTYDIPVDFGFVEEIVIDQPVTLHLVFSQIEEDVTSDQ